jgi:glycosyltransferase involved in cell wall biosynthesis
MPKVSVIIPCYNQGQYLDESVNSVLNQTFQDFEIIIINDGSDDNTEEIALNYCSKDSRVKYIKKENRGLASARNAGLKLCTGSYIQFLDADDVIDKSKFEIQLRYLENASHYALCYSDYFASTDSDLLKPHGYYLNPKFKSENYLAELITEWESNLTIPCHCFLFKSNLFKDNDIHFDETLPNHEDWECWMNIFSLRPEVFFTDMQLATYRIHSDSMCFDINAMKDGYLLAISKQKRKLKDNRSACHLLSVKYNQVKYDVASRNSLYAAAVSTYRRFKIKIKSIFPGLF